MESMVSGLKSLFEMENIDNYFKQVLDKKLLELLEKYKQER